MYRKTMVLLVMLQQMLYKILIVLIFNSIGIPEGLAATVDAGTTTTGPAGGDAEVT